MIKIITIGKTKEKYLREGIEEFLKRIKRFEKIEYKEVNNLEKINKNYIILDIYGELYSSEQLAELLKKSEKEINFIIGDENGIPENIKKNAKLKISMSKMTFTHEMTR